MTKLVFEFQTETSGSFAFMETLLCEGMLPVGCNLHSSSAHQSEELFNRLPRNRSDVKLSSKVRPRSVFSLQAEVIKS